jgi:TRAP-type mannitol/chloroaromatic compound transport system permease small subunit
MPPRAACPTRSNDYGQMTLGLDALDTPWAAAILALAAYPLLLLLAGLMSGRQAALEGSRDAIRAVDWVSNQAFAWTRWLSLWLVLVQFAVVVLRYIFGIGFIFLQEALLYFHGTLFLIAASGALLHEGHVRIDIFYRGLSPRGKAWIDLIGTYVFLIPVVAVIAAAATPYVSASWSTLEGSKETSGIPAVFVLKTMILVFVGLMFAQALSFAARAALVILGAEPPPKPQGPTVIA